MPEARLACNVLAVGLCLSGVTRPWLAALMKPASSRVVIAYVLTTLTPRGFMDVLVLLMFVGAVWVVGAVAFFAWNLLWKHHEHSDRLAMLPLEDNWSDSERATSPDEESKVS
jgi:hypothetical protein